jgi:hypothetical protein
MIDATGQALSADDVRYYCHTNSGDVGCSIFKLVVVAPEGEPEDGWVRCRISGEGRGTSCYLANTLWPTARASLQSIIHRQEELLCRLKGELENIS